MNEALIKIMLKNLGVDPEKVRNQFGAGVAEMKKTVEDFQARLDRQDLLLQAIAFKVGADISGMERAQLNGVEKTNTTLQ